VKRTLTCSALAFVLVACATRPPRTPPQPTGSIETLAAAIATDAQRSDHEPDPQAREQLAADALSNAEACLAQQSRAVPCLYGHALALGLQARVHPTHAIELLNAMLSELTSAEAADADYDRAGPARVRALVLLRAPGWPLGPGDADSGLESARRAVMLQPDYPPNLLTLAEALAKTGDAPGAKETYTRARKAAEASTPTADRDDWLREADEGLRRR
jgi:hypothetical protein